MFTEAGSPIPEQERAPSTENATLTNENFAAQAEDVFSSIQYKQAKGERLRDALAQTREAYVKRRAQPAIVAFCRPTA